MINIFLIFIFVVAFISSLRMDNKSRILFGLAVSFAVFLVLNGFVFKGSKSTFVNSLIYLMVIELLALILSQLSIYLKKIKLILDKRDINFLTRNYLIFFAIFILIISGVFAVVFISSIIGITISLASIQEGQIISKELSIKMLEVNNILKITTIISFIGFAFLKLFEILKMSIYKSKSIDVFLEETRLFKNKKR